MGHPKAVRAVREYPTLPLRVEDGAPKAFRRCYGGAVPSLFSRRDERERSAKARVEQTAGEGGRSPGSSGRLPRGRKAQQWLRWANVYGPGYLSRRLAARATFPDGPLRLHYPTRTGALLRLPFLPELGSRIEVLHGLSLEVREFRVISLRDKTEHGPFELGVEILHPARNFWGVSFPDERR